jgi:hypothetical protein
MLGNAGFQYRFSGCFVCNSDAPAPGSAMKQALQLFQSLLEPDVLAYDNREHHDQYQANQQIHAHRRLPSIRYFRYRALLEVLRAYQTPILLS